MKTLFAIAMATSAHTLDRMVQELDEAALSLGFRASDGLASPDEGETLLIGFEAHADGRCWTIVEQAPRPLPELVLALARTLGELEVHELRVDSRVVPVRGEPGESGFESFARSYTVSQTGERRDLEVDEDVTSSGRGDPYETASTLLDERIDGGAPVRRIARRTYASTGSTLSPRLRDLSIAIRGASKWEIREQAGKHAVHVVQSDGSKRIALLDAEELRAIRAEVDAPERTRAR